MANRDNPDGFTRPKPLHGFTRVETLKSAGTEIFKGDLLEFDASGRVQPVTGTPSTDKTGTYVAIAAAAASANVAVACMLAKDYSWELQMDDNTITDDTVIGNNYDITRGTGDATTKISAIEIDGSSTTTGQVRIVGVVGRPDNDVLLTNARFRVTVNTFDVTAGDMDLKNQ